QYGWCLVEPQKGYHPPAAAAAATASVPKDGTIMMPTGHVSVEQLTAVLSTLPLDLTFVDADDRVAFFSEGPDRIFARSKAIIGRKVQHCHPPRSADTVNKILDDFRSGRQSVAEFWINFQNKFVHIRYFAVRNDEGKYLGTIELTQDLAPFRKLSGERRLLAYGSTEIR
ncbi:MAG: PAS domain-containing protein, partial [Candidatus Sulfotelmatobacter sp.]